MPRVPPPSAPPPLPPQLQGSSPGQLFKKFLGPAICILISIRISWYFVQPEGSYNRPYARGVGTHGQSTPKYYFYNEITGQVGQYAMQADCAQDLDPASMILTPNGPMQLPCSCLNNKSSSHNAIHNTHTRLNPPPIPFKSNMYASAFARTLQVQWEDPGDTPFEYETGERYWILADGSRTAEDPNLWKYAWWVNHLTLDI